MKRASVSGCRVNFCAALAGWSAYGPVTGVDLGPVSRNGPFFATLFVFLGHRLGKADGRPRLGPAVALVAAGAALQGLEAWALHEFYGSAWLDPRANYYVGTALTGIGAGRIALARPDLGAGTAWPRLGALTLGVYLLHVDVQQYWLAPVLAPRTLDELIQLRAANPGAVLLAGSTDVGLWVTKQMRDLGDIIYLGHVDALKVLRVDGGVLEIGAGVSLEEAYNALCQHYPNELGELRQRFASLPIRNAGTLGGNVANGSPIGDSMPWLIALGAQVVLCGSAGERVLALEDFYLDYMKKDLQPGEFVQAVRVPLPREDVRFRTYKLAKRFDQDISAVCAAFALRMDGEAIAEARIAFGGMAATPKRAAQAEAALNGRAWNEAALADAMAALARDYAPLSDMRASSEYRMKTAQNLLRRFWLETRKDAPLAADAVNAFAVSA